MNAKRLSTAFIIALAVSALCTWLLGRRINTQAAVQPDHKYVAPAKPLAAGEIVKAEDLELVNWPVNNPIVGAFVKADDVVGRAVLYPVDKDQPITDRFLSAVGSGLGLSAKIPDGMRAVALHSDEVMGVAGFIFPGSHLDVLVTYHFSNAPDPITFTVLQDAEVLAVGQKSQPDPEGKPVTATVVTLLLTPEDAERAVLASSQGAFHFVLRSGSDKVHIKDVPLTVARMTGNLDAPRPGTNAAPRDFPVRRGPLPQGITVETIAGDKQSSDTFGGGR
jgi:pilus assembly protein CpaB